jgi:hypothetical protein
MATLIQGYVARWGRGITLTSTQINASMPKTGMIHFCRGFTGLPVLGQNLINLDHLNDFFCSFPITPKFSTWLKNYRMAGAIL